MTQKSKYLTKSVLFGGKTLTLYSLDGATWSSRKDELETIHLRHDAEQVTAAQLRGEADAGAVPPGGAAKQPASPALRRPTAFSGRFAKPKPGATPAAAQGESTSPAKGKAAAVQSAPKGDQKSKKKVEKKPAAKAESKKKPAKVKSVAKKKKAA